MQYELKTHVLDQQRKTFAHLEERYGDRPATRYEQGSIGLQPTENFHYRPTWAPDKELYDPAYSTFVLSDPDAYTDPRQYYYTPYVTARSAMHENFGKTLSYVESRDLLTNLPESWKTVMESVLVALRHYESGAQLISSGAARFAYGGTIAQCCAYAAFDRIGNAQALSRIGIALAGGASTDVLTQAKTNWLDGEHLQPLRRLVEETFIEPDWAKAMITIDIVDQLLYALTSDHLDQAALVGGAGPYSLVTQHSAEWFADHRRWLDALYGAWLSDTEHAEHNQAAFSDVLREKFDQAAGAVRAIAVHIDQSVDVGAVAAHEQHVANLQAKYADLGLAMSEKEVAA